MGCGRAVAIPRLRDAKSPATMPRLPAGGAMGHRVPTRIVTFAEVMAGRPQSAAEIALLEASRTGAIAFAGKHCPKDMTDSARAVRAGLIRFLLLGGDSEHRPHQAGVHLRAAWIDGQLDFEGCETHLDLALAECLFPERPVFRDAQIGGLSFRGSRLLNGCDLHRTAVEKGVRLTNGFHSTGPVDLNGATIFGQLSCVGGQFDGQGDAALSANGATIESSVLLGDGFQARGQVNLDGAKISGQLNCTGGWFNGVGEAALSASGARVSSGVHLDNDFRATGTVNLTGLEVSSQLVCSGGIFHGAGREALDAFGMSVGADVFLSEGFQAKGAVDLHQADIERSLHLSGTLIDGTLRLHSAQIGGGFYWQDGRGRITSLDLTEARVGALHDDARSWQRVTGAIKLCGLRYDSIQSEMSLSQRLAWLDRDAKRQVAPTPEAEAYLPQAAPDFDPRPYTELARTYLRMGEKRAAARVLEAREDKLRDAELHRVLAGVTGASSWQVLPARLVWLAQGMFKALFGYGYRPWRALVAVAIYWAVATRFFSAVYSAGQFAPNSDVVLTSADWQRAVDAGCPLAADPGFADAKAASCVMPLTIWTDGRVMPLPAIPSSASAGDYETFSPGLYAADLFLPLDTIGQTEAWAPSKDRGWWGWAGYYARFPIQLFGWILVALAAATLTGVIGRKED